MKLSLNEAWVHVAFCKLTFGRLDCSLNRAACWGAAASRSLNSSSYHFPTLSKDLLWPNVSFFPAFSLSSNGLSHLQPYSSHYPFLENLWWLLCMHDCNGRSRREGAEGGRKRGRVTRVQRVKVEYMRSLAWYRLVVHMNRADPHRTCLSSGQCRWPLLRQTVMPGVRSPAPNTRTAQPASLCCGPQYPTACFLLSFDDLGQLPSSSPSSHGTVSWYSPSQLSSDCLPFSPKV